MTPTAHAAFVAAKQTETAEYRKAGLLTDIILAIGEESDRATWLEVHDAQQRAKVAALRAVEIYNDAASWQ